MAETEKRSPWACGAQHPDYPSVYCVYGGGHSITHHAGGRDGAIHWEGVPGPAPAVPHPETRIADAKLVQFKTQALIRAGAPMPVLEIDAEVLFNLVAELQERRLRSTSPQHDAPDHAAWWKSVGKHLVVDPESLSCESWNAALTSEPVQAQAQAMTVLLAEVDALRASQPVHHDALTNERIEAFAARIGLDYRGEAITHSELRKELIGIAKWARDHAPVHDSDALAELDSIASEAVAAHCPNIANRIGIVLAALRSKAEPMGFGDNGTEPDSSDALAERLQHYLFENVFPGWTVTRALFREAAAALGASEEQRAAWQDEAARLAEARSLGAKEQPESRGTFACPICRVETPHGHSQGEIDGRPLRDKFEAKYREMALYHASFQCDGWGIMRRRPSGEYEQPLIESMWRFWLGAKERGLLDKINELRLPYNHSSAAVLAAASHWNEALDAVVALLDAHGAG